MVDLYPCKEYDVSYVSMINEYTPWKYKTSSSGIPYNWREVDFDDSLWPSSVYSFPASPSDTLYIRGILTV